MKKIFTLLLIASFFSFYTNAQTSDLIKYLPGMASIVIDIDCGTLSQKISKHDLSGLKFFDSLFKKGKSESKKLFVHPSETGINNRDHFYIVLEMKKDSENGNITVFGKLTDEAKFAKVIQTIEDKKLTRKTTGQNKMIMSENFVLGWNSSVFVVHTEMPIKKWSGTETKSSLAEKKKQLLAMEKKCIALLTPKQQPVVADKNFETFKQSKGDFKIWIDGKSIMDDIKQKSPFSAFNMTNFMQPDHQAIVVNFEKGKIISNSFAYYDESTLPSVKNVYGEKLNAELFKKIPAGQLFGLYAMSFKPGGLKSFFESTGLAKELKKEKGEKDPGLDPMLILDNLKGDVLIAVTMPERVYDDNAQPKTPFSNMNFFFAATVKDEARVNKLVDSLRQVMEEKRKQNEADTTDKDPNVKESVWFENLKVSTKVENGIFFFAINDNAKQIDFNSSTRYDAIYNDYGKRPTLMMFDIKTLMSMMMGFMKKMPYADGEPEEQSEVFSMFEIFDKMIITGGQFENDAMVTTSEVKFTNADENGLKQMLKLLDLAVSAITKVGKKGTVKDIELKEN